MDMSGIICITPLIAVSGVAGWAIYGAAIAAAAAGLGLQVLADKQETDAAESQPLSNTVQIPIDTAKVVEQSLQRNERIVVKDENIEIAFIKNPRGDCRVEVTGEELSCEELKRRGEKVVKRVNQEYARIRVKQELKKKGFILEKEDVDEDGTIRLTVGKRH
jgi:hypothetical protein